MSEHSARERIRSELQKGMALAKCRRCGCMKETLEIVRSSLASSEIDGCSEFLETAQSWLDQVEPTEYSCLGCEYCFPAMAANLLEGAFPGGAHDQWPSCVFESRDGAWPPVPGEYFAFCEGGSCPTAVSTLASVELAERLASVRPPGLCIVGKTETENIGIDKVVRNTVSNPTIRFLLLAGRDSAGHRSGRTLLALAENGVDERMRVIGSPSKRPVLRNVSPEEVDAFRKQVHLVDMIGCEDVETVAEKLTELSQVADLPCCCEEPPGGKEPVQRSTVSVIQAAPPTGVEMDRAGYFVVIPQRERRIITVEHYSYDNRLLRFIEGRDARTIYMTIIENGWVTQLSHAAYLGRELAKAEFSIESGCTYVQDGA